MLPALQNGQVRPGLLPEPLHSGVPGKGVCIGIEHLCGYLPMQRMFPHPAQIRPREGLPHGGGDLPCRVQLLLRYPCLLHQGKDQFFHIHDRGHQQRLLRFLRLQRLHSKPRPDADPIHPDMLPYRMHPGVNRLQLPGDHPRHQLFRAVFPGAVLRQIDSQYLPACRASCAGKAGSLGCAAVFAVDVEIDPAAALAVQDSRDACDLKLDFFHNGSLLFWGVLRPVFSMIAQATAKHKQEKTNANTILNGLRYRSGHCSRKVYFNI